MNEHVFPSSSHIGGWFIDSNTCDDLIQLYHRNDERGNTGAAINRDGMVDKEWKDCNQICFTDDFLAEDQRGISYLKQLQDCLTLYLQKYTHAGEQAPFGLCKNINLQYYKPGQGFNAWHCEDNGYFKDTPLDIYNPYRHLVFMTYLNDCIDGGTQFKYQELTTPAIKGLTLIWPTAWTHTHKGQISLTQDKYIITGWFDFLH